MVQTDSRQSENIVGARAGVVDCCAFWSAWLEVYRTLAVGQARFPRHGIEYRHRTSLRFFCGGVGDIHCVFNVIINNMAMGYR